MFRPATRILLRAPGVAARGPVSRRLISTAPPDAKSRSWKSTIVRLGLAAGAVYYYNTSSVFAEQPSCMCEILGLTVTFDSAMVFLLSYTIGTTRLDEQDSDNSKATLHVQDEFRLIELGQ